MKEYNYHTEMERKTLEILRYSIMSRLRPELANNTDILVQTGTHIAEELMTKVSLRVPAEEIFEIKYESSGWQLFKKRWFPRWLIKRFPLKYDIVKGYFLHPEIKTRGDESQLYYVVNKIVP